MVSIPRGTIFDGMPLEIGRAPFESNHVSSIGTCDGAPLNPPGRGVPDREDHPSPYHQIITTQVHYKNDLQYIQCTYTRAKGSA